MLDTLLQLHLLATVGIPQQLVDAGLDRLPETAVVSLGQTGALAFDDNQRDAVDEQDHVGNDKTDPTEIINAELVDGEKGIVALIGGIKIDKPHRHIAGMGTVAAACPQHPLDEFFGQLAVAVHAAGFLGSFQFSDGPINGNVVEVFGSIDGADGLE